MNPSIMAFIGLLLSAYALNVYFRSKNKNYSAVCDIHEHVSCSKAFGSKYGKTFEIHNALYGIVFYLLVIVLHQLGFLTAVLALAGLAVLRSVQLAYISYITMKNFCLVCTVIYIVNVLLLLSILS